MQQKEYTGSVYIGVVGPDTDNGECRDSVEHIIQRTGDTGPFYCRATKGYEARQIHLQKFLESKADFILFLDHDMVYQPDTLDRLRSHKLPFVSGFYMRRTLAPAAPVWYKPWAGFWPIRLWMDPVESGKLYPIGASGWGCILLHREVVMAVREKILKGEQDIIEDDMDVWPYELPEIMGAIRGLRALADARTIDPTWVNSVLFPAMAANIAILEKQIRPLRVDHEVVGSDIRYPFYALAAGYQLMGDPDVCPTHMLEYGVGKADWNALITLHPEAYREAQENWEKRIRSDARRIYKQQREVRGA